MIRILYGFMDLNKTKIKLPLTGMVARLPQRLKSMFFLEKNFFTQQAAACPLEPLCLKIFQRTLILAFETNSPTTQIALFSQILAPTAVCVNLTQR